MKWKWQAEQMTKMSTVKTLIVLVLCFSLSACKMLDVSDISRFRESDDGKVSSSDGKSNVKRHETQPNMSSGEDYAKNDISSSAQTNSDTQIENIFSNNFSGCGGNVSYGYYNYSTGENFIKNSRKMKSASVIKLFIMEYAYSLMEKEEISSDTQVSGAKLSSLIESMITISDNNATNALIDYFTMDKLNAYFAENGYNDTTIGRRMLDFDAQKAGKDNFTSVNDVMKFLNKLYANKGNKYSDDMLSVMSRQKVSTKIRRNMPTDVKICNKTGELSDVENDAGIVFTQNGDFAVVFIVNSTDTYNVQNAIAKTTRQLYDKIITPVVR